MVQLSQLKASTLQFTGEESCDSGYLYEAKPITINLNSDYSLDGVVTFASPNESTLRCEIVGNWDPIGKMEYTLSYANMKFKYHGFMRENVAAGKFWITSSGNAENSYESVSDCRLRGTYRHVLNGTKNNPEFLSKFVCKNSQLAQ